MPFDGIGYQAEKPSLWSRITRAFQREKPAPAVVPMRGDDLTVAVLVKGRALIEHRADWVQRRYQTKDGRYCAVGALRAAARLMKLQGPPTGAHSLLLSVAMSRGFNDIETMNDNSSHRQVLSAFDKAIQRAKVAA